MTGREIYKKALVLINEYADHGEEWRYDTAIMESNAPTLINMIAMMTDELDCTVKGKKYGINDHLPAQIKTLDDELVQHPYITMGVIPYGLAYLLLAEENAARASEFYGLFIRERDALERRFRPTNRHTVTDCYK